MTIMLVGVQDFLDMTNAKAGLHAMAERDKVRAHVYAVNFMNAVENGVDDSVVLLYAQCALNEFDKGNIQ